MQDANLHFRDIKSNYMNLFCYIRPMRNKFLSKTLRDFKEITRNYMTFMRNEVTLREAKTNLRDLKSNYEKQCGILGINVTL